MSRVDALPAAAAAAGDKELTAEQREIYTASCLETHGFVPASFGSGKTECAVEMMARVVEEGRLNASQVMAITFTRTAGRETSTRLRARLQRHFLVQGRAAREPEHQFRYIDTFHAIASQILNRAGPVPNLVHVDECLPELLRLLRSGSEVAQQLKASIRLVVVDEFQDSNRVMFEILRELAHGGARVWAVGDDDQAIFGFAGSSVEFFQRFRHEFQPCRVLGLSVTHRCTQPIVDLAQAIRNNGPHNELVMDKKSPTSYELYLQPGGTRSQSPKPLLLHCQNMAESVRGTCERVRDLIVQQGVRPSDIGILCRTGRTLDQAHATLLEMGVPSRFVSLATPARTPSASAAVAVAVVDKVALSTIHGSKGSEYLHVFVLTLHSKYFPDARTTDVMADRRLLFVAITRAKRYLTIWNCYPHTSSYIRELFDQGRLLELFDCAFENLPPPSSDEVVGSGDASEQQPRQPQPAPAPGLIDPYSQVEGWINKFNGFSFGRFRRLFMHDDCLAIRCHTLPLKMVDPETIEIDSGGQVRLAPWTNSWYVGDRGIEEAMKNFLNAHILRLIQGHKFQQVGDAQQPYRYDPADGARYYGQLRAQGGDIPKRFKGVIAAGYRRYQDRTLTHHDCVKHTYWTAAAEMVRGGRSSVMHTPITSKTFEHYRPMLGEVERMVQFMIYDPGFVDNGATRPDWDCVTMFHIPSRLSKDSFHLVIGSRLVFWTCQPSEYGGMDVRVVVKAISMALLYNLQHDAAQIRSVYLYDVYARRVCEVDLARVELDQQRRVIEFLSTIEQGAYDMVLESGGDECKSSHV